MYTIIREDGLGLRDEDVVVHRDNIPVHPAKAVTELWHS